MPKIVNVMSAKAVEALRKPGMHAVGGVPGLFLKIVPPNSRYWVLRATMPDGRRGQHGMGSYPFVPLAEAREAALDALRGIRKGADPIEAKRQARREREAVAAMQVTFKEAAEHYIERRSKQWRESGRSQSAWEGSLSRHAYPKLGHVPASEIERRHVLDVLEPLWANDGDGRLVTAERLRGRIEKILDYARERGWRPEHLSNPAVWVGRLEHALSDPKELRKQKPVEHHPGVPIDELYGFMAGLRARAGSSARCLEFVALTAVRSGEARGAKWSQLDLDARIPTWTIPGDEMKMFKEHRVPLSTQAVALLKSLPRYAHCDLVFPSPRANSELSDMALLSVMRKLIAQGSLSEGVPHGLRSNLRTWAAERTDFPRQVVETALAHSAGDNSVERAYLRTDFFERRAPLMQAWADFLDKPPAKDGGNVVPLHAAVG